MKKVSTYQGLDVALSVAMSDLLTKIGTEIQTEWKKHIQENWYDKYDPVKYIRFYDYLESIVVLEFDGSLDKIKIVVGSDNAIMNSHHPSPYAGNYYDAGYGEDSGEVVRNMMEYYGMELGNRKPLDSIETMINMYEQNKISFIKKSLRKYGFDNIVVK